MSIKRIGIGVVLVGVLGVSAVFAQDGGRLSERPSAEILRAVTEVVVSETGLTALEIRTQLHEGMTLAAVVEANGGSVDVVSAAAIDAATQQITEAVTNGTVTQERADRLLEFVDEAVDRAMNTTPQPGGIVGRAIVARGVLHEAAEATGLEPEAIVEQLRGGTPLSEILTTNGVDPTTFVDDFVAQATERINTAVANGRISQERADEMIANLREGIAARIDESLPVRL